MWYSLHTTYYIQLQLVEGGYECTLQNHSSTSLQFLLPCTDLGSLWWLMWWQTMSAFQNGNRERDASVFFHFPFLPQWLVVKHNSVRYQFGSGTVVRTHNQLGCSLVQISGAILTNINDAWLFLNAAHIISISNSVQVIVIVFTRLCLRA